MALSLAMKFVLTISLGALIGVEREFTKKTGKVYTPFGMRTSILTSILGLLFVLIGAETNLFLLIGIGVSVVLVIASVSYIQKVREFHYVGATTYVATIICFLVGMMIGLDIVLPSVISAVLVTAFLSFKDELHSMVTGLSKEELQDAIKFAILAFVILPLLPNKAYGPFDVFNPFNFWLVVVTVSGISFFSYVGLKTHAEKGLILSSLLGGIVSSTENVYNLTLKANKNKTVNSRWQEYVMIVCASMLLSNVIILLFSSGFNFNAFFRAAVPSVVPLFSALYIFRDSNPKSAKSEEIELSSPFAIMPAFKFALIYFFFTAGYVFAKHTAGDMSLYIVTILGSLALTTAVSASIGSLLASNAITLPTAVNLFVLANCIGFLNKNLWAMELKDTNKKALLFKNTIVLGAVFAVSQILTTILWF